MTTAPISTEAIAGDATRTGAPLAWADVRDTLTGAMWYWLATTRPSGAPHVRPVLAVWAGDALHTTTGARTRKGRNLHLDGQATITTTGDALDLIVEGNATRVLDADELTAVAEAYHDKYAWPVTVVNSSFSAPYGAPTAGPGPYDVYRLDATVAYALGTSEETAPRSTRWRFAAPTRPATPDDDVEATIVRIYEAFNRRDVDEVMSEIHPQVDWPDLLHGVRLLSQDQVRAYWARQFELTDPQVHPLGMQRDGDSVVVTVHQVVRAADDDEVLADQVVQHVYDFRDGLVAAMDVRDQDGTLLSPPRVR